MLRNLQRRSDLGLAPGKSPLSVVLPTRRRAALVGHKSYGYQGAIAADVSGTSGSELSAVDDMKKATLESRCGSLEEQLADVEQALLEERARTLDVGNQISTKQEEMSVAVDEHDRASKALSEARKRAEELSGETLRLQAELRELDRERSVHRRGSTTHEQTSEQRKHEDRDAQSLRLSATLSKKLALHRAHLLQCAHENQELRRQCAAAGVTL